MNAQQAYVKYLNKEFTDNDFAYHMRRNPMLKEYISPISTVSDIISILKGKGVIWEEVSEETPRKEAFDAFKVFGQNVKIGQIMEYADSSDKEEYDNIEKSYSTPEIKSIIKKFDNLGFDTSAQAANAILTHDDFVERWDLEDAAEHYNLQSELKKLSDWQKSITRKKKIHEAKKKEPNTPAPKKPVKKKMTADDVNYYEFTMGWRYEYQNTPAIKKEQNVEKAKEIAVKNLSKDPMFYSAKLFGDTFKKETEDAKVNSKNILKQKSQKVQTSANDKKNAMVVVKDADMSKKNVKDNLGKQEKAKVPKGVKTMKLKESIKDSVKKLLGENEAYKNYIESKKKLIKEAVISFKKGDYIKPTKYNIIFKVEEVDDDMYMLKIASNDERIGKDKKEWKTGDYVDMDSSQLSNFKKVDPDNIKLDANPKYFNPNEELSEGSLKNWITGGFLTLSTIAGIGKIYQIDKSNKEAISKAREIFSEPLNKMSTDELSKLEDSIEGKIGGSIKTWFSSTSSNVDSNLLKKFLQKDIGNVISKKPELLGIDKDGKIVLATKTSNESVVKEPKDLASQFNDLHKDLKKSVKENEEEIPFESIKKAIDYALKNSKGDKEKVRLWLQGQIESDNKNLRKPAEKGMEYLDSLKERSIKEESPLDGKEIKDAADKLLKQFDGDKKKAIERCDYALDVIKKDPSGTDRGRSVDKFKKVKALLLGHKDLNVNAEKDAFSNNEEFQDNTAPEYASVEDVELESKKSLKEESSNKWKDIDDFYARLKKCSEAAKKYWEYRGKKI